MKIGILCAMQEELSVLSDVLSAESHGHDNCFSIALSGIGKVNAALAARDMIDAGVDELLSVGVAGGIGDSVHVGDIVIGSAYRYHDVWCGKPNKAGQLQGDPVIYPSNINKWLPRVAGCNIKTGTIVSGDWFVQTKEEAMRIMDYLSDAKDIIAVDMESTAMAQACYMDNIPFTSIRAISDCPMSGIQQEQYDNFWKDVYKRTFTVLKNILI